MLNVFGSWLSITFNHVDRDAPNIQDIRLQSFVLVFRYAGNKQCVQENSQLCYKQGVKEHSQLFYKQSVQEHSQLFYKQGVHCPGTISTVLKTGCPETLLIVL